jgi:hypothetical protein
MFATPTPKCAFGLKRIEPEAANYPIQFLAVMNSFFVAFQYVLCRNNIQAGLQSEYTAGCTINTAQAQRKRKETGLSIARWNDKPADRRSKCDWDCVVSGKLRHLPRRGTVPSLIVNRELAELV